MSLAIDPYQQMNILCHHFPSFSFPITCLSMIYLHRLLQVIHFLSLVLQKSIFFFFAGGGRVGRGSIFREFLHVSLVIFLREIQNTELWNQNTSIYSITLIQQNSFQKLSVESAHSPVQLAMLGSE